MNTDEVDFLINCLKALPQAIAKTLGSKCEVVLHDLRHLEKSIIKIEHGYITGRKIGDSITDLGLRVFKKNMPDLLLNYSTTAEDGRSLKSTTTFFRDRKGKPIAALCINIDVTDIKKAAAMLDEMSQSSEPMNEAETFKTGIFDTISSIIEREIGSSHLTIPSMKKENRTEIVGRLEEMGVFQVKGAVRIVAKKLNVSKFAIYNYLEEIRENSQGLLPISSDNGE